MAKKKKADQAILEQQAFERSKSQREEKKAIAPLPATRSRSDFGINPHDSPALAPIMTAPKTTAVTQNLLGLSGSQSQIRKSAASMIAMQEEEEQRQRRFGDYQVKYSKFSPDQIFSGLGNTSRTEENDWLRKNAGDLLAKSGKSSQELFESADKAYRDFADNADYDWTDKAARDKADEQTKALKANRDYWEQTARNDKNNATTENNMKFVRSLPIEAQKALRTVAGPKNREAALAVDTAAGSYDIHKDSKDRKAARQLLQEKYKLNKETVDKLTESMRWAWDAEDMEKNLTRAVDDANANGFTSSVASVGTALAGSIEAPIGVGLELLGGRTGQYSGLNPNNRGYQSQSYTAAVRGQVAQNIEKDVGGAGGKVLSTVYKGAMSAADSATRLAAGLMTGGASEAGMVSSAITSLGSFGSTVQEMSQNGVDPTKALLMGVADATIEYATEKWSIDNLLEGVKLGKTDFRKAAFQALKQAGVEPTEELSGMAAGIIAQALILGKDSDINRQFGELISQGATPEQAKRKIWTDLLHEAGETIATSAVSGFVSSAGGSAVNAPAYIADKINNELNNPNLLMGDTQQATRNSKAVDYIATENAKLNESRRTPAENVAPVAPAAQSEQTRETTSTPIAENRVQTDPVSPIRKALETAYESRTGEDGRISNRQANEILGDSEALDYLHEQTGISFDGTKGEQREAVKTAMDSLFNPEPVTDTVDDTPAKPVTPAPANATQDGPSTQEKTETQAPIAPIAEQKNAPAEAPKGSEKSFEVLETDTGEDNPRKPVAPVERPFDSRIDGESKSTPAEREQRYAKSDDEARQRKAAPIERGITIHADDWDDSGDIAPIRDNVKADDSQKNALPTEQTARQEAIARVEQSVKAGDTESAKVALTDVKTDIADENGVAKPPASEAVAPVVLSVDKTETIGNAVSAVVEQDKANTDPHARASFTKAGDFYVSRDYDSKTDTYKVMVMDSQGNTYTSVIPADRNVFYAEVANATEALLSPGDNRVEDSNSVLNGSQENQAKDNVKKAVSEMRKQDKSRFENDFKAELAKAKTPEEKARIQALYGKAKENGSDGSAVKVRYSLPGYSVTRILSRDGNHYEVYINGRDGLTAKFSIPRDSDGFYSAVSDAMLDMEMQSMALKEAQFGNGVPKPDYQREYEDSPAGSVSKHMIEAQKRKKAEKENSAAAPAPAPQTDTKPTSPIAPLQNKDTSQAKPIAPVGPNVATEAKAKAVEDAKAKRGTPAVAPIAVEQNEDGSANLVKGKENTAKAEQKEKSKKARYVVPQDEYLKSQENQGDNRSTNAKPKSSIEGSTETLYTRFQRLITDKGAAIEKLGRTSGNDKLDPAFRTLHRVSAMAENIVRHGDEAKGVKSLSSIYDAVNKTGLMDEFNEYLVHRRNVDATSLERRGICANRPILGDLTEADSQSVVSRYESAHPEFKSWANDVYAYSANLMDHMVSSGQVSQEQAKLMRTMYPSYVPISRVGVEVDESSYLTDYRNVGTNQVVQSVVGSDKPIAPIFETLFKQTYAVEHAAAMNNLGMELYRSTFPNYVDELNNPYSLMFGAKGDVDSSALSEHYDPSNDFLYDGDIDHPPMFTMYVDGQRHTFQISDDVYLALRQRNDLLSKTSKVLGTLNDFKRRTITGWNPAFNLMRNPVKDAQEVIKNSKHPLQTYAAYPAAYHELVSEGDWYKEYRAAGGADIGHFLQSDVDHFNPAKGLDWLESKFGLKQIQYAGNVIEQAPRLAEYIVSRKNGASVEQAMLDASRVTVDFSSGGELTKFADRNGCTFLNASVQGALQHARNFQDAKAKGVQGWLSLAGRYAAPGIVASVLNNMIWGGDDDYEELSEYIKDRYYIVGKFGDGTFVRIPKGRTDAVIESAIKEIKKSLTGDDEADFMRFFKIFMENMAPNNPVTDNIFAPIVQTVTNKSWYGEPIVNDRLSKLPEWEQYDEKTDDGSIALTRWLHEKGYADISPKRLNYLIDNTSGVIGDTIMPYFTQKANVNFDHPLAPALAPLRDVFTTDGVLQNRNQGDFYDLMPQIEERANASDASDQDKILSSYMTSYNTDLSKLYEKQRNIQMNRDLKRSEKYEQAREVRKQINALQKEALDGIKDYTSGKKQIAVNGNYAEVGKKRFDYNAADKTWYSIGPSDKSGPNSYYETEQQITKAFGVSYPEYWNNKDKYDAMWRFSGEYLQDKAHVPVTTAKVIFGTDTFARYAEAINKIPTGDDGKKWKTVQSYVNQLDLDPIEKDILMKVYFGDEPRENAETWQLRKDEQTNARIVRWLDKQNISDADYFQILTELGYHYDQDGKVYW